MAGPIYLVGPTNGGLFARTLPTRPWRRPGPFSHPPQPRARHGGAAHLDPLRIREARKDSDFSPATVVMLYLLFAVNLQRMPQLWRQLRVASRVVSHDFHMGGQWPPEQIVRIRDKTLYAWTITPEPKEAAAQG